MSTYYIDSVNGKSDNNGSKENPFLSFDQLPSLGDGEECTVYATGTFNITDSNFYNKVSRTSILKVIGYCEKTELISSLTGGLGAYRTNIPVIEINRLKFTINSGGNYNIKAHLAFNNVLFNYTANNILYLYHGNAGSYIFNYCTFVSQYQSKLLLYNETVYKYKFVNCCGSIIPNTSSAQNPKVWINCINNPYSQFDSEYNVTNIEYDKYTIGIYANSKYSWNMFYDYINGVLISKIKHSRIPKKSDDTTILKLLISDTKRLFTYDINGELVEICRNTIITPLFSGNVSTITNITLSDSVENYSFIVVESKDSTGNIEYEMIIVNRIKAMYGISSTFQNKHNSVNVKYSFADNKTLNIDYIDTDLSIISVYGIY